MAVCRQLGFPRQTAVCLGKRFTSQDAGATDTPGLLLLAGSARRLAAPAGWQRPQGAPSSEQHCLQSPQKKEEGNARLLASRHRTCEAVKQMRKEVGEGLGD